MVNMFRFNKLLYPFLLVFLVLVFFYQFFLKGFLPIPADTVVGLYHPYRDFYAKDYPRGIPFKNFLITDPVRQQYPWKNLAIKGFKDAQLPLWNPYSFSGTPHLANIQSGVFYPLNILFFFLPFHLAWSLYIISQPLLAGLFTYLYLRNQKLDGRAVVLGGIAFSFGGFSIAWLEWGNIISTALWLPLILLVIDKITLFVKPKISFLWPAVFVLSLVFSFFAGHLQTFFYISIVSFAYFFFEWFRSGKKTIPLIYAALSVVVFLTLTAVQWIPSLDFILSSARDLDKQIFTSPGWFIPWQHLVQFIIPDFFGNPTTLNYWGTWNYAEFVGYSGVFPITMAALALIAKRDKKTVFFCVMFLLSIIFSLPTVLAKLPYMLDLPFISSSQPTRLLFVSCFSISVLSAFGFDYALKNRGRLFIFPFIIVGGLLAISFASLFIFNIEPQNVVVAKRNIIFPVGIFALTLAIFLLFYKVRNKRLGMVFSLLLVLITVVDLFRFGWKFTPFTPREYLFPKTQALVFLERNVGDYRVMTTDSRIMPPNFSVAHRIQSIEGYDPLFTQRYAEFVVAMQRGKPDISPPFNFNRIITPHDSSNRLIDLLGVKYVLSLDEVNLPKLVKVYEEGQTKIYENKRVVPRAFLAEEVISAEDREDAIKKIMDPSFEPGNQAVVEGWDKTGGMGSGSAKILKYSADRVIVRVELKENGFLVLTDNFYPSWKARITESGQELTIYPTDYTLRGVAIPKGTHIVEFYATLL
ncbi:MAG: hypothetical protein UT87_C0008G0010 [Candidatus Levybacteria bacterium GW2011_GWC1_40_19]|nr:MAG: hypothetical protein US02_C0011G0009 [Candidatus Levybacteria bacterium GW2011_GWA2_36_13]KKR51132.1 MAG: hypothetical protein UT87_C0008G0010 [Candidatus Levybacteria bacterium GW2011_GWC1_40_19]OGH20346.1 MAG: hypothetical protein A2695_02745 [Candidatus Levybacteria bacterium RIFCSPHIGHO2_01_FULL_40_83]OGH50546.1 MAG: hypothetical protein A3J18_00070 [Candidatus Levybacteria bacterium RIFCSPLOWO2_02_FULL_40_18]HBB76260.1 hypothetical protein [Candidatus Levybacteria bacterium]